MTYSQPENGAREKRDGLQGNSSRSLSACLLLSMCQSCVIEPICNVAALAGMWCVCAPATSLRSRWMCCKEMMQTCTEETWEEGRVKGTCWWESFCLVQAGRCTGCLLRCQKCPCTDSSLPPPGCMQKWPQRCTPGHIITGFSTHIPQMVRVSHCSARSCKH